MGRPTQSVNEYVRDSEIKIALWGREIQAAINQGNTELRNRLKNKVAALRARMREKIEVKDDDRLTLTSSQANLKELTKIILAHANQNKQISQRIHELEKINIEEGGNNQDQKMTEVIKNEAQLDRHAIVNQVERYVWKFTVNSVKDLKEM